MAEPDTVFRGRGTTNATHPCRSRARARGWERGGRAEHIQFEEARIPVQERSEDLLTLNAALTELARADERKSRVVELRFFAGLTIEETAEAMSLNAATVRRD